VAAGSYIALFQLTPASARPYMAGSKTNSFLELTFGYNGLGRITGSGDGLPGGEGMGGGAGGGNAGFGGAAGLLRMFGTSFGGEVSWLLPAALILLAAGLWFTRREARTSRTRAALLLWGGWLLVTAGIFSFMGGIIHPYYAVALAPATAALVGIGSVELWRGRAYWPARAVLGVVVLAASIWSALLLDRDASWLPWLRVLVVVLGVLAAAALLLRVELLAGRFRKAVAAVVVVASLLAAGLGTAAWTIATAAVPHSGSIPTSGPASAAMGGFGNRDGSWGALGGAPEAEGGSSELAALLSATATKWSAAVSGATQAANLELASDTSVIALGGWNGSDPYPTLAQFQQLVANGEISYFITGGMGGGFGGGMGGRGGFGGSSEVATWVAANFEAQTVGNSTVYKLTK
jgi:4-amino-4-deoxy-L-arabinose transferase-like glycosyltransferase